MKIHESLQTVTTTSKVAAVIFFGALIVAAFYTGIWYERNRSTLDIVPAVSTDPTPTPTMKPTAAPLPVTNKTFFNSTYKYSFTYPDNLTVGKFSYADDIVMLGTKSQADLFNNFKQGQGGFGFTPDMAYLSIKAENKPDYIPPEQDKDTYANIISSKSVIVSGIKGTEYNLKLVNSPKLEFRNAIIMKNDKIYEITVYDLNNNYTFADQIINSFKFN